MKMTGQLADLITIICLVIALIFALLDTRAQSPQEYAAWGTNDDYAERCFIENLGLVLA